MVELKTTLARLLTNIIKAILYIIVFSISFYIIHFAAVFLTHHVSFSTYWESSTIRELLLERSSIIETLSNSSENSSENSSNGSKDFNDSTIIIGVITIWITIFTIWRQHIQRKQDLALNFPNTSAKECSIILNTPDLLREGWLFHNKCNMGIKLHIKKAFSLYFSPEIYRVYIIKKKKSENKIIEKIKIHVLKSSYIAKNNKLIIGMVSKDKAVLNDFLFTRPWDDNYSIEIVVDIKWKNNLYLINKSTVYIRNIILLDYDFKEVTETYKLKVDSTKMTRSPIIFGFLKGV